MLEHFLVSGQTNHIKTRVALSLNVIEKLLDGFHYVYDTQYDCKFFSSTTRQFKMNDCNNKIKQVETNKCLWRSKTLDLFMIGCCLSSLGLVIHFRSQTCESDSSFDYIAGIVVFT